MEKGDKTESLAQLGEAVSLASPVRRCSERFRGSL